MFLFLKLLSLRMYQNCQLKKNLRPRVTLNSSYYCQLLIFVLVVLFYNLQMKNVLIYLGMVCLQVLFHGHLPLKIWISFVM